MKLRILAVEDRGAVLYPLVKKLESLGHEVLPAFNVAQARAVWNGGNSNIACIIIDLNIPADLSAKQAIEAKVRKSSRTQWQTLAGWIWLEQEVLVGSNSASSGPKVIVLSGYLDFLKDSGIDVGAYPRVKFIRKGSGIAQSFAACIREIPAG